MKCFGFLFVLFFVLFFMVSLPVCNAQSVDIDLGTADIENGLVNTQQDASDGEAEIVDCGPAGDVRDCKKNWGLEDPTVDAPPDTIWPDSIIYFNVTDPAVKDESKLRISVTVYDDPALQANTTLSLHYTNDQSTGPGDIGNTFSGHPVVHTLTGSDKWVTVSWDLDNAGFQTFMQGTSDFRVLIGNNQRVCIDSAEVTVLHPVFPTTVNCVISDRTTVTLDWENLQTYDTLVIRKDGAEIASLDVADTSYIDNDVSEGDHTYEVIATAGGESQGPSCLVTILPDMTGHSVTVDLADTDIEDGISNSHTMPADGGDGENESVTCGPVDDQREARKNWGADDPTPDGTAGDTLYPDNNFYFNVLQDNIKGQHQFILSVTAYADPALPADTGLFIQYTNDQSTGPGDIPNTFFPLNNPTVRMIGQSDAWVTLQWAIEDAGFRTFMQGDSDFRLTVNNGSRVCIDSVQLTVGIPSFPFGLSCTAADQEVTLSWNAWHSFDTITVKRDDEVIATLTENEMGYVDAEVPAGAHTYSVTAVYNEQEGGDSCEITIETAGPIFKRGDANDDGSINLADAIKILGYLFNSEESPACQDAADSNDDGSLNLADAITILGYLFSGGEDLPMPFPDCGLDGTPGDNLDECVYTNCP